MVASTNTCYYLLALIVAQVYLSLDAEHFMSILKLSFIFISREFLLDCR